MNRALEQVRRRAGLALRDRVAGPDAERRAQRIWGTPGQRWFTPQDPVWRVHGEASMYPGGVAALLLQSLHPLAMAGVAQHSGYRGDPWGRLQRTSGYVATTTFGTVEHARELIGVVRSVHETVQGVDARGRPYRAGNPELLEWVHVAEIASFLAAHQAYAAEPLDAGEADRYVAQAGVPARELGVLDPPRSVAELEAALVADRPHLEVTDEALDAASFLLRTPLLPWATRPGFWVLAAGGVGVLPDWARSMLGLPTGVLADRVLRTSGLAGTAAVRWAMRTTEDARTLSEDAG